MPLATCPRCNIMFDKGKFPVCGECEEAERKDYEKISDTLLRLPNLPAKALAETAEVDLDCVMRLVESGRIEVVTKDSGVKCGRCGAPAISKAKKLCMKCLLELDAQLAQQQAKLKIPNKRSVTIRDAVKEKQDLSKQ